MTLQAARFDVVHNGQPVEAAEVCLFHAGAVASPVTRFFASADVTCSPASGDVAIGAGVWNVFARKGTSLISERVELVTEVEAKAKRSRLELVDAATLVSKLGERESLFVWVPRTRSAFPAGASVPAGQVIPVVVEQGAIRRVAAPLTLAAGETRTLESIGRRPNHVDVVVPVAFRTVPEEVGEAPHIALIDAGGKRHAAEVLLAKSDVTAGETLQFFRDVPAGALTASLSGRQWKKVEEKLTVDAATPALAVEKALEARATTKLTVRWWSPVDPAQLTAGRRTCDKKPDETSDEKLDEPTQFRARLLWCADRMLDLNAYTNPRECTAAGEQALAMDALQGEATFEDVAAGVYYVELAYPRLPRVLKKVEVAPRETSSVDTELRFFTFHGRLTRGGEPIEAEVFGSLSDAETGRYEAVLTRNPGAFPFQVITCDGTLNTFLVPEEAPVENAAYDIELAANRIVVDIVDKKTGAPIPKMRVSIGALDEVTAPNAMHFAASQGRTDERGRVIIEPVLTNKKVRVCADTQDYENRCAEPFVMGKTIEKAVRLELTTIVKRAGRVIANGDLGYAQIFWFSREGTRTELVRGIQPDGTFTYQKTHAEGEIVIFTSDTQPLFASLQPGIADGETFELRMPAAPRRNFTVTLSSESRETGAFLALRIGDVVVPINVLGWHLMTRGLQSALEPGHSVKVVDVLATGPTRVILIPFTMVTRYPGTIELPLVPEIGTFPQQDLGDRDAITFGEQMPRAIRAPRIAAVGGTRE